MILLSAHLDRVHSSFDLSYENGKVKGLLDNMLGVMLVYSALLEEPHLVRLEQEGKLKVWHNTSEEWGELDSTLPKLDPKHDMAIVVDVCADAKRYADIDFAIENVSLAEKTAGFELGMFLQWEGFKISYKPYSGNEAEEDESWYFRERGIPTISFIIPIEAPNNGWHRIQDDSSIDIGRLHRCKLGLIRTINFFA